MFLLDGGSVAAEVVNGQLTATYLRGANLIARNGEYYLFNAHGDVVNLTNASGAVTRTYAYDAFGNEKNPDEADTNPFRYCGEYWDSETGTYYLRARYYDPTVGRFTQQDTHWNVSNMIYGDNPQKISEREDALGLKTYTCAPQISAIMQSGNLYVYCVSDPVNGVDPTGRQYELERLDSLNIPYEVIGYAVGSSAILWGIWTEDSSNAEKAQAWAEEQARSGELDKKNLRDNSVYVIVNNETQEVWYVGITKNFQQRQYKHQRSENAIYNVKDYTMTPILTGLTRGEARAMEQLLITGYTLESAGRLKNRYYSISESRWGLYDDEFLRMASLISGYFDSGE